MTAPELRSARLARGWSQQRAASRLGVSQPYLALLESGKRHLTGDLARRAMKVYGLPPTVLPPTAPVADHAAADQDGLARELAALGYPALAHLRPRRSTHKNPVEVLLTALVQDELEARLVEALPWLLLRYPSLDRNWLVREAKLRDLQNRVGFVVSLARQVAERMPDDATARTLRALEAELDRSRLAREDTLCRASLTGRERQWLAENRPEEARRWNLLTDWTPDALRYVA